MADSVKSIFKILIKVPIIILVCFGIFNIFAFGLSYVKMIGLSYIAMQAAIENNYITPDDKGTLENYMKSMETEVLSDISFSDNTTFSRQGQQYGEVVNVGVKARYNFIWPLTHKEQTVSGVGGLSDNNTDWIADTDKLRQEKMEKADTNIEIEYIVPGLKYYPDLE